MASRSPFAAVAAGSAEDEVKATKKLCGEASSQAVEVRTHLNSLIEALQQVGAVSSTPDRLNSDPAPNQQDQDPPPPPAAEHSFDIRSAAPASGSLAGVRRLMESPSKSKQSVSFQTLNQPAYSANLDSFLPGSSRRLEHETSSLSHDYDTSQMGNPLFDSTMSHERVEGTRGVALTRASVAAQMMQSLSQADAETQKQLAEAVTEVRQQVSTLTLLPSQGDVVTIYKYMASFVSLQLHTVCYFNSDKSCDDRVRLYTYTASFCFPQKALD